jgi:hypothetical protein
MAARIADQDVVAAAAVERLGAVGGDEDIVTAGTGKRGGRCGIVDDGRGRGVAGGNAIRGRIIERTARRRNLSV